MLGIKIHVKECVVESKDFLMQQLLEISINYNLEVVFEETIGVICFVLQTENGLLTKFST